MLESKVQLFKKEIFDLRSTQYTFNCIIGKSNEIKYLKTDAQNADLNDSTVLVAGEIGIGKELSSQTIYNERKKRSHPFVQINCTARPKDLLEPELFGYEEDAFTGAKAKEKPGKFKLANYGTIFLDEIGDLPLEMQPKFLRALEEKEFERIGVTKILRSGFSVMCATNQNLENLMKNQKFRKDLFYRLNVIPIYIPPLRERQKRYYTACQASFKKMTLTSNRPQMEIEKKAAYELKKYDWPGNARELSNVLERAMYSSTNDTIYKGDLPFNLDFSPHTTGKEQKLHLKRLKIKSR
jgi:transcriptional regulator with PAS, ATPase and Fis domain